MCDILRVLLSSTNALCKHSQRNDSPFSLCTIDLHGIYEYMAVKYAETLTAYIIYAMGSCLYLTAAAVSDGVKIMQERKKKSEPCSVGTNFRAHTHTHTLHTFAIRMPYKPMCSRHLHRLHTIYYVRVPHKTLPFIAVFG